MRMILRSFSSSLAIHCRVVDHKKIMAGDLQLDEIAEGIKDDIPLYEADTHEISILIPEDLQAGDTIHIITEITSDDPIPLKRYARTILTVT